MWTTIFVWVIIIGVTLTLISIFAGMVSAFVDAFKDRDR